MEPTLEELFDEGWSLIPVGPDKRPLLKWSRYQNERASWDRIEQWRRHSSPSIWGGVTGQVSGRITLDFDGPAGEATLSELGLPAHRRTPGGGFHTDFWAPDSLVPTVNGRSKRALGEQFPGLDIRGDGGYIALLGASSKGPYRWLGEREPLPLEELDPDVRVLLRLTPDPDRPPEPRKPLVHRSPGVRTPSDGDNPELEIWSVLIETALDRVRSGDGRNDSGFWLACQLRDHKVARGDAEAIMALFAETVPATNPRGVAERYNASEASASLAQAYAHPARDPFLTGARSRIVVTKRQMSELLDESVAALEESNDPPWLFQRGGGLVRIDRSNGAPTIEPLSTNALDACLARVTDWFAAGRDGDDVAVFPPGRLASRLLTLAELPFPHLAGVIRAPTLRVDGTLLSEAGFDVESGLFLDQHPELVVPAVSEAPGPSEIATARRLIVEELFGEFPFADSASRANAVGLFLTACLRSVVDGLVPMALVDAPTAGTGKSILTSVVATVATGRPAAMTTPPDRNDDELRKRITSLLVGGATYVVFDNAGGTVESPVLSQLLTADVWSDRILGVSQMVSVRQDAIWTITGNNVALGGDLPRRCYLIRLDARVANPWRRSFCRPDLMRWATENRGVLLGAALTLGRAWFAAGCPTSDSLAPWGTFHEWQRVIGGILQVAGIEGFLTNLGELQSRGDADTDRWVGVLSVWRAHFGDRPVRAKELAHELDRHDRLELPSDLVNSLAVARDDQTRVTRLANQLRKLSQRRFDDEGLRVEAAGQHGATKTTLWAIRTDRPTTGPTDCPFCASPTPAHDPTLIDRS